jgi:Calcium binding
MRASRDGNRDNRITQEILVDAYGEEEQMMSWYYYLEDTIQFPFAAVCTKKRRSSPIHEGGSVEVVSMAPAEECDREMYVEIVWDCDTLAVPLSQLSAPNADVKTQEAIADWHYWVG